MEELRLTDESIDYLKQRDEHVHLQIKLGKQILLAQVMHEEGNPESAYVVLKKVYQKAEKYELFNRQRDAADKLKRISLVLGKRSDFYCWSNQFNETVEMLAHYRMVTADFNSLVHPDFNPKQGIDYCNDRYIQVKGFRLNAQYTGIKTSWMHNFIQAHHHRERKDYRTAQSVAWKLLRILKEHPIVFSRQMYLILMQFILENMYYLNKKHVVIRAGFKVEAHDSFPIYQTFPLYNMHILELFRQKKVVEMEAAIDRILKLPLIDNFYRIHQHLELARLHALFLRRDYGKCLKEISRNPLLQTLDSTESKLDMRVLELICFWEKGEFTLVSDKLEALRKYLSRNDKDGDLQMYWGICKFLKSRLLNKDEALLERQLKEIARSNMPIYTYQYQGLKFWIHAEHTFKQSTQDKE